MQVFRLVSPGTPDRVIAFDTLPEEYLRNLPKREPSGLPRHWSRWLKENGSVDKSGNPVFYICDYLLTNNDREIWQNVTQYTRRVVDTSFRLMDKIEEMAPRMAKDSRSEMTLEPEDVPIIPVTKRDAKAEVDDVLEESAEAVPARRGRKPKEI